MELVEYYKHHSLKEGFRSLDTTLQVPYKESENSDGQRSNKASSNLLSPKAIGIAIARYDFCARDMRELSLLKGDVVKIYTKMSANGWWRGEVNGRVGWFPSTYVEEDEWIEHLLCTVDQKFQGLWNTTICKALLVLLSISKAAFSICPNPPVLLLEFLQKFMLTD